jgi:hypothetical protein
MKKVRSKTSDDMREEYDFRALGHGVRGKYAQRLKGKTLVALDAEVAEAFPTSAAVNRALRSVLKAQGSMRGAAPVPKRVNRRPTARKT